MAKTTFVVTFGEGASASDGVVVELEPSLNVAASGNEKTSFSPGDVVYFSIHYPSNLRVGAVNVTSGDANFISRGELARSQSGLFFVTPDDPVILAHMPSSPLSFFWYGRIGQLSVDGKSIRALNAPCVGDVSYKMVADLYRYVPPADMVMNAKGQFTSGVVIVMEAA